MNNFIRILIISALGLFLAALLIEAGQLSRVETPDPSKVAIVFVLVVFVTVAIGAMAALWLVPAIGDKIGGFFFNPGEEVEKDIHTDAIAAMNRGDYEEAIQEFEALLETNVLDTVAINDIVQICVVKLEDPERAARFLEAKLEDEWPEDHTAFLASRLVDVYWTHLHDAARARTVLVQIAETMPDTRHAANAQHRLREIEQGSAQDLNDEPLFLRTPSIPASEPPATEFSEEVAYEDPEAEPPQDRV